MRSRILAFLIVCLGLATIASAQVKINELLAKNDNVNQDEDGNYGDWVELYNAGDATVDLTGMFLTDNFSDFTLFTFPPTTLDAGAFLLIWCDNTTDDPITSPDTLHAGFKLGAGGESVGLFYDNNGTITPVDTLTFGAQTADISLGRYPDGGDSWVTFSQPTPGATNVVAAGPLISTVARTPLFPEYTEASQLTAEVFTGSTNLVVQLNYKVYRGSWETIDMLDDGLNGDGAAGDDLYGASIPPHAKGSTIFWYIHASDGEPSESVYPVAAPGSPLSFRVTDWTPEQVVRLAVREPSGIAYNSTRGTLFTHNDENDANIFEINTSGEVIDSLMVGGFDYEGIAFNATYDTMFIALEADFQIEKRTLDGTLVQTIDVAHDPALTDGLEGIVVDHSSGHIFVLQEKNPSQLIELSAAGVELNRTNLNFSGDVSGMTMHPTWGTLFIVSDQGYSLNEVTTSGEFLRSWYIPLDQAEGVTFGADATTLYMVSDRGGSFYEFSFEAAAYIAPPTLLINEFIALNTACHADPDEATGGDPYDDWVEIYNPSAVEVDMAGMSFADINAIPHLIPTGFSETIVPAGGYVIVYFDNEPEQGPLHIPEKLTGGGDAIYLYDSQEGSVLIDSRVFTAQTDDISEGRYPDGADNWGFMIPTPGVANTALIVGIDDAINPLDFMLSDAFPNPFNPTTAIRFSLPMNSDVEIVIYDVVGRVVTELQNGYMQSGTYEALWSGQSSSGNMVPSGVYFYEMKAGSFRVVKKMTLLK